MRIADVAGVFAYSVSCALLHQLLQTHYFGYCRGTWFAALGLDPSPYCAFVRKTISALEVSPLIATGLAAAHRRLA